jgi:sterol desaturase/sphingolipid hydroxylase (fatty acid hydroxylase superfamily)
MEELLRVRLGGLPALALVAVLGLPLLAWTARRLERAGHLARPASRAARSLRTDLVYLLGSPLTETFSRTFITLVLVGCAWVAGLQLDPALLEGFGPVVKQPRWLVVLEMLVLGDFFYYWGHRLAHGVPWLWRFHAVHHSTPELRWTSATRSHPAEAYVQLLHILPLVALGFPADALAPLMPLVTLYAMWIHSHSSVGLRRVSYLCNSPLFHRWHHARDVSEGTVNFAGLFPIYDRLFGTYRLPRELPVAVGIDDPHMPETCLAQLVYPLRPQPGSTPARVARPALGALLDHVIAALHVPPARAQREQKPS